jgi:hypothetical protein
MTLILKFQSINKYKKQQDINVNVCNYENDTPLHKASLASRYVRIIFY